MCLLTTEGSGLVVTPEAQSSGARGLLGVVGEVGFEEGYSPGTQDLVQQIIMLYPGYKFPILPVVPQKQKMITKYKHLCKCVFNIAEKVSSFQVFQTVHTQHGQT